MVTSKIKSKTAKPAAKKAAPRKSAAVRPAVRVTRPAAAHGEHRVGFRDAVRDFFDRYFMFNGVSNRAQYWWVALFVVLVLFGCLAAVPFAAVLFNFGIFAWFVFIAFWLAMLFSFAVVIPSLALMSRRVHDAGFSAWVVFGPWIGVMVAQLILPYTVCSVLEFAVGVWALVLTLLPSKTENNPYRD